MTKFNKLLAYIGFALIAFAALIQFNAHYAFIAFLQDVSFESNAATYILVSFVFIFSFFNIARRKVLPIIFIVILIIAFVLFIIMTGFPDLVLKIIPVK